MLAKASHNGSAPTEPGGYGIRIEAHDRDKNFDRSWDHVVVELEDGPAATITLGPSFWKTGSELRSADLGQWLLDQKIAPWAAGNPPRLLVRHVADNRFSARLHQPVRLRGM